jgi:hypothetical protein
MTDPLTINPSLTQAPTLLASASVEAPPEATAGHLRSLETKTPEKPRTVVPTAVRRSGDKSLATRYVETTSQRGAQPSQDKLPKEGLLASIPLLGALAQFWAQLPDAVRSGLKFVNEGAKVLHEATGLPVYKEGSLGRRSIDAGVNVAIGLDGLAVSEEEGWLAGLLTTINSLIWCFLIPSKTPALDKVIELPEHFGPLRFLNNRVGKTAVGFGAVFGFLEPISHFLNEKIIDVFGKGDHSRSEDEGIPYAA